MALATVVPRRQDKTPPTADELTRLRRDLALLSMRPWFKATYCPMIERAVDALQYVSLPPEPAPEAAMLSYRHGDLRFSVNRQLVTLGERAVSLSPTEAGILAFLCRTPGRAFTRREIVEQGLGQIWTSAEAWGSSNRIDVCVHRLRLKLDTAHPTRFIGTVRSVGYYLVVDDEGEG